MEYTTQQVKGMSLQEIRENAKGLRAASRRELRPRANPKVMAALKIADLEPSPERDHRLDPSAEDPKTIEMINEHHAKQVEIAREAGIEIEEEVETVETIEEIREEEKPNPAPETRVLAFSEKLEALGLASEECEAFFEILDGMHANSELTKMLSKGKRNQKIALVLMGHESEAKTALAATA